MSNIERINQYSYQNLRMFYLSIKSQVKNISHISIVWCLMRGRWTLADGVVLLWVCLRLIDDLIDAKDQKDQKSSQNYLLHFHRSVSWWRGGPRTNTLLVDQELKVELIDDLIVARIREIQSKVKWKSSLTFASFDRSIDSASGIITFLKNPTKATACQLWLLNLAPFEMWKNESATHRAAPPDWTRPGPLDIP